MVISQCGHVEAIVSNSNYSSSNSSRTDDVERAGTVVPVITLGRYGSMVPHARPSDQAFIAMFDAAQHVIRFLLQDVGPVNKTVVGQNITYMGWTKEYMKAMGRAMWERDVDIEIVFSNPGAGEGRGTYSNGWSCAEVAAEIVKAMQEEYPDDANANNDQVDLVRKKVSDHLRVCFLNNSGGSMWRESGNKLGLHSKLFIVDDVCTYVGSPNLYLFDLAEWGVLVDSKESTADIKATLWTPMWKHSYGDVDDVGRECTVDEVMDALLIDRDPRDNETLPD
jgi:phosphatidylserine/phosphatidylglycerophosphate/cardiolipin synthase-like enzyme